MLHNDVMIYREAMPRVRRRGGAVRRFALLLPVSVGLLLAAAVLGSGFVSSPARPNPDAVTDTSRQNLVAELQRALGTVPPAPVTNRANDEAARRAQAQVRPAASPTTGMAIMPVSERVAITEAAVRTGKFDADLLYRDGTRVVANVRFDLGDGTHLPRVYMVTTYHTSSSTQTSERVTLANETLQRLPNGKWTPVKAQPGAFAQVQALLPHADAADNAAFAGDNSATLRWYDASRDMDVALDADPATGVPQKLKQVSRTTGAIFTVTYRDWNGNMDGMFPNTSMGQ